MRKLLYLFTIAAFLTGCGTSEKEIIENFKGKMLELCQTSNELMDNGLTALESGVSADSIDVSILDGLKKAEMEIEKLSKEFRGDMKLHGITKEAIKATHESLSECFGSLQEKHKKLKEAGVEI